MQLFGPPQREAEPALRVDRFHPVPNLLQIFIEPSEPLNYGRLWRERRDLPTPHLVATSGLLDPYTPKRTHWGLAGAFGLPVVEPAAEEVEILRLLDVDPSAGPAVGNLSSGGDQPLTAGLLQYADDGHFAVFSNPDAQEAYRIGALNPVSGAGNTYGSRNGRAYGRACGSHGPTRRRRNAGCGRCATARQPSSRARHARSASDAHLTRSSSNTSFSPSPSQAGHAP